MDEILQGLLVPRPGGSQGLGEIASFIETTLQGSGAEVSLQTFSATPHGFALLCAMVFVMAACSMLGTFAGHFRLSLALAVLIPLLVLAELEWLRSPVSGLLSGVETNVVGTYPGHPDEPLLIFTAHYDTTTSFGDHLTWEGWSLAQGPALLILIAAPAMGLWRRRHTRRLAVRLCSVLALVPFGAMTFFFTLGPLIREPSRGALDNGGSVAALLELSGRLAARPAESPTVKLVFLAGEEERGLGSWSFAKTLSTESPPRIFNLEILGTDRRLGYATGEGFVLRRFAPASDLIAALDEAALELWGETIRATRLPGLMYTDGRSFLAHGLPAVTITGVSENGPRRLHSTADSADRLSVPRLEEAVDFLELLARTVRSPRP